MCQQPLLDDWQGSSAPLLGTHNSVLSEAVNGLDSDASVTTSQASRQASASSSALPAHRVDQSTHVQQNQEAAAAASEQTLPPAHPHEPLPIVADAVEERRPVHEQPRSFMHRLFLSRLARAWIRRTQIIVSSLLNAGLSSGELSDAIANQPTALITLQRLRVAIVASWSLSIIPVAVQIWCVVRAWQIFHEQPVAECTQMRHWLYGYLLIPLFLPCFALGLYFFIAVWVFCIGSQLQESTPHCKAEAPDLWKFMEQAKQLTLVGCGCGLLALAILLFAMRLYIRIRQVANLRGPTPAHVIERLPVLAASEVSSAVECPICLDRGDSNLRWIELPCHHMFHQDCILPWLAEAQACPLCRFFLAE